MNLIDRKGEVITNQPPQGLTRDPYASEEFVVEAEGKTAQCYRRVNLRHLKKGNIFKNFNDFKLFQA